MTDETLVKADTIAARLGSPQLVAVVDLARAFTRFVQGSFREAYHCGQRSVAGLSENSVNVFFEWRLAEMIVLWSLVWLGDLGRLAEQLGPFLRSADARGDLYATTCMRSGPLAVVWLVTDEPEETRAMIREVAAKWTERGYLTQHYWVMYAESQVDLYAGRGHAAWIRVTQHWPKMRRSLMLQAQVVRIEATFLRARAALATACEAPALAGEMLRAAGRDARALGREDADYAAPLSLLVRASLASIEGRDPESIGLVRGAFAGFEEAGLRLHMEASRWRLGQKLGGEEGAAMVALAVEWARGEGVVNPAAMFAMIAPGFARLPAATPRLGAGDRPPSA